MNRSAHLHIWDDRFLFTTLPGMQSDFTRRHTVTLLAAMHEGQCITLEDVAGRRTRTAAALVGKQVARRLDASEGPLLSLNFDPQAYEHHALSAFLGRRGVRPVELALDARLREDLRAAAAGRLEAAAMFRLTCRLARTIRGYRPLRVAMDMRVLHIAQKIKKELPLLSSVEELAAEVGLSGHRLRHLFADRLGLSIRSYLLWAKMRRAAVLIGMNRPLTEIAHEVGFADSAHLTRTFKEFFGLTPSFIAGHIAVHVN